MQPFELHLDVNQPINAIDLLSQHCQLSKQQLKLVMQKGAVWLTHGNKTERVRRAKKVLQVGHSLHLYYNEIALSDDFTKPQLIKDCGDYSVWNKPSGMMSQGSKWGDHSTISRYAQLHLTPQRPAFIVHRLDRATQGVILIAHSKRAVRELTSLFENRQISKKYQAIVNGEFPGMLEFDSAIDERSAYTKAMLLRYDPYTNLSLLDIEIGSGRKHQIRRHLLSAQFPISGDRLYGAASELDQAHDLQLCAYQLSFLCPLTQTEQCFTIAPDFITVA
ncbi:MAG: RNA pseudouridine synthase [Gammaproteobacteria bacterium]|nr:RNA pseudouridine synthase [Gammaproteobacteria bacterium]